MSTDLATNQEQADGAGAPADAGGDPAPAAKKRLGDSDEFSTPADLFAALNAKHQFRFDLCANERNALTPLFCGKETNALTLDWAEMTASLDGWLWCNPPYSNPNLTHFSEKLREECARGAHVGFLVPANTATDWFHATFFRGGDIVEKRHIPRGPLRGLVLGIDFSFYRLTLYVFDYRLSFSHPEMEKPEQANKGHVFGAFESKRRYTPKSHTVVFPSGATMAVADGVTDPLRGVAEPESPSEPTALPAAPPARPEEPAGTPPDPSPEAGST